ncbi:MAG: hypothetical protein O3C27_13300 [Actinomycetota bacterium]|nr:hypothetical protein [Actinomycetota bacterium]
MPEPSVTDLGPPCFRVLVRLPDRPGALGSAASRIGALQGDVIGFEIVERGLEWAIDEFVVTFPPDVPLDLLTRELTDDGATILGITPMHDAPIDAVISGLQAATELLSSSDRTSVLAALSGESARLLRADWAVVMAADEPPPRPGPGESQLTRSLSNDQSLVVGRRMPFSEGDAERLAALVELGEVVLGRLGS